MTWHEFLRTYIGASLGLGVSLGRRKCSRASELVRNTEGGGGGEESSCCGRRRPQERGGDRQQASSLSLTHLLSVKQE